jgi:hypothetical protein
MLTFWGFYVDVYGMKSRRAILRLDGESGVYHCVSRVAGNQYLLGDKEKEVFRKQLFQVADFCGVEVLSYCVMSNHFHVMVRIPWIKEDNVTDEELVRRFGMLYPVTTPYQKKSADMIAAELKLGGLHRDELRKSLLSRMHNLSHFMKTLKQRFTLWFNKTHGRVGTLWSERYKSVLVQDNSNTLLLVAAYIDLNPIRARMCDDPKDYRFSSYGAACGGNEDSIESIRRVLNTESVDHAMKEYRKYLFATGSAPNQSKGFSTGIIDESKVADVMNQDGELSLIEAATCRIRYFTDGVVLGEGSWVNSAMEASPEVFGENRISRSHRMKGSFNTIGLCSARNLQKKVIQEL